MGEVGWAATIVVLLAIVFAMWRRAARRPGRQCPEGKGLYPECLYVVTISSEEISVRRPDDSSARVRLAELRQVTIETDDYLQTLPTFDDHALRKAMGCTSNKMFVVYVNHA